MPKFHRITERPGLKRTSKIISFQPPCHGYGHQPLDHAAQSHVQPCLKCYQRWGIHNLSEQPVPESHHPQMTGEEFLPNIQCMPTVFQIKAISPHPVSTCPYKKSLPPQLSCRPPSGTGMPSPLQAEESPLSQPVLAGEVHQPSDDLRGALDPVR